MFDLEFDDPIDFIENEVPSYDLEFLAGWQQGSSYSPWDQNGTWIVGEPAADAQFFDEQNYSDTCAIVSQKMILDQFGFNLSEDDLRYEAFVNGWYRPGMGTHPEDVGKLLEHHGIDCHTVHQATQEQLAIELAQGHKVIVGIDSSELVSPDSPLAEFYDPNKADHAVVVTGMGFDTNNQPVVYLNDPGGPDGAGKPVPLSSFLAAWEDSGNHYIATDYAPEDLASHPDFGEFFNNDTGMYMDEPYWKDWLTTLGVVGGAAAASLAVGGSFAVGALVGSFANEQSTRSMDSLDDKKRNTLFRAI